MNFDTSELFPSIRTAGDYDDDLAEITHRLNFNGDGEVSVDEELAMRILARGANEADPRNVGIPRLVRLGVEVRF